MREEARTGDERNSFAGGKMMLNWFRRSLQNKTDQAEARRHAPVMGNAPHLDRHLDGADGLS